MIGGSWEQGNPDAFARVHGFRGDHGGFYIGGLSEIVLPFEHFGPGRTAGISYKYVKREKGSCARIRMEQADTICTADHIPNPQNTPNGSKPVSQ